MNKLKRLFQNNEYIKIESLFDSRVKKEEQFSFQELKIICKSLSKIKKYQKSVELILSILAHYELDKETIEMFISNNRNLGLLDLQLTNLNNVLRFNSHIDFINEKLNLLKESNHFNECVDFYASIPQRYKHDQNILSIVK